MKRIYLAAAAISTLSIAACSQKLDNQPVKETTFEITATTSGVADTRTTVDADWNVAWENGDALAAVINGADAKFSYVDGNRFQTSDFTPTDGVTYNWNLLYHSDAEQFTAASIGADGYTTAVFALPAKSLAAQAKANDKSHLGGLTLCGSATSTGAEQPTVTMKHLSTVIVVNVTNNTGADVVIKNVKVENDAEAAMSGEFLINCQDATVKGQTTTASASIDVTDGTIHAGETAEFYVPAVPFTVAAGKNITVTLTDSNDIETAFVKNLTEDKTFAAGKFKSTEVELETVNYRLRICDYGSLLKPGLTEGNGVMNLPESGVPATVSWEIKATKVLGDAGTYNIIDGTKNGRMKIGTGTDLLNPLVFKTTNLADKFVTKVTFIASMATTGGNGTVIIKVGDTEYVSAEEIKGMNKTGLVFSGTGESKGDVEVSVDGCKKPFFVYSIIISYKNN